MRRRGVVGAEADLSREQKPGTFLGMASLVRLKNSRLLPGRALARHIDEEMVGPLSFYRVCGITPEEGPMPRRPRCIPESCLVAVSCRTVEGKYRLRPQEEVNDIILGALGRALEEHEVCLHAATALSSHYHLLLTVANAKALSGFMQRVQRKISYEINRLHNRRGPLWEGRYHAVPVTNEREAQVEQLKYVLGQGCKEGLVASPREWPGVQSVRALVEGKTLEGHWFDRTAYFRSKTRDPKVKEEDYRKPYEVTFSPLPAWAHLDSETYRHRVAGLVEEIEEETARMHRRQGTRPLGARKARARHPFTRPKNLARSRQPLVHAATEAERRRCRDGYRAFYLAYREAADRLASGDRGVEFPLGSFPPALPFVSTH